MVVWNDVVRRPRWWDYLFPTSYPWPRKKNTDEEKDDFEGVDLNG